MHIVAQESQPFVRIAGARYSAAGNARQRNGAIGTHGFWAKNTGEDRGGRRVGEWWVAHRQKIEKCRVSRRCKTHRPARIFTVLIIVEVVDGVIAAAQRAVNREFGKKAGGLEGF